MSSAAFAMVTGQTYNSLVVGLQTDARTVRVVATPVAGGTVVNSPAATVSAYGWGNVLVEGLNSGPIYTLQVLDAATSQVLATCQGNTLSAGRESFTALTSSCQRTNSGFSPNTDVPVWGQMASDEADFFVHQGDLHYVDAQTEPPWREATNNAFSRQHMRDFLAETPMFYHWDNHDWGGNSSWRESPVGGWAPSAIRELFGSTQFPHPRALYSTWAHQGIRFVDTDQWTLRDEAVTSPSSDYQGDKTMLGTDQLNWLFQTWLNSKEALIVWFCSFPLYSNFLGNGRWGNYRAEAQTIQNFLDENPSIKARIVCVGGDSHNICADDGASTMWGLPSLNSSPLDRLTDPANLASGTWNIANLPAGEGTTTQGFYSRLTFTWNDDKDVVVFGWQAVRSDGQVVATWNKSFGELPSVLPSASDAVRVWDGTQEQRSVVSVWDGAAEEPAVAEVAPDAS